MQNKLWFKAKRYGYGWYPASWEGWVCILLYLALVVAEVIAVGPDESVSERALYVMMLRTASYTIILVMISYLKGEKPRWRWGK